MKMKRLRGNMVEDEAIRNIERAIDFYDRGILTVVETEARLLESISPQNVTEVFAILPEELRRSLRARVDEEPVTDEEWKTTKYVGVGGVCYRPGMEPPPEAEEEREPRLEQWKQGYRRRVEAIRRFLDQKQ